MSTVRPGMPGATRTCPHCKATILETAAVCPACKHHLRFDSSPGQDAARDIALSVEGRLPPPRPGDAVEYTMVVVIRNERGEEVTRHVVGVGAFEGNQTRSFSVSVEAVTRPSTRMKKR